MLRTLRKDAVTGEEVKSCLFTAFSSSSWAHWKKKTRSVISLCRHRDDSLTMWQELDTATINSGGPVTPGHLIMGGGVFRRKKTVLKTWTLDNTNKNWTVGFRKTQEDSLPEAQTSVIDKDERACVTPKENYFGEEKWHFYSLDSKHVFYGISHGTTETHLVYIKG